MMAKLKKELVGEVEEEEEEKKEKMKNLKQIKGKTTLPKPTPGRHELKMAMMRRGERADGRRVPNLVEVLLGASFFFNVRNFII